MSLLLENKLSQEIRSLLMNETHLRIAVAFIGDGASQWINPNAIDVKITCSLAMNGTNPAEVEKLIQRFGAKNVKQIDNLHAKLYIGSEYAIVGSANLSANGLGTQPTALREAGYKFKLDQPSGKRSLDWFDDLWKGAREISDKDLKDAKEKWTGGRYTEQLSDLWKLEPLRIQDYMFAFYYDAKGDLTDAEEEQLFSAHGADVEWFEEGDYDNFDDADKARQKIHQFLNLNSGPRLTFCVKMLYGKKPKTDKFRANGSFVALILTTVVLKTSSNVYKVLSIYQELVGHPFVIDEKFVKFLSSAYLNQAGHPNFYPFVNGPLQQNDCYCTYTDLKHAL